MKAVFLFRCISWGGARSRGSVLIPMMMMMTTTTTTTPTMMMMMTTMMMAMMMAMIQEGGVGSRLLGAVAKETAECEITNCEQSCLV